MRVPLPCAKTLGNWVRSMSTDFREKLIEVLSSVERFSLCADLWSQTGLSHGYLGLTAHFYFSQSNRFEATALAVMELEHPHSAERIHEAIFAKLDEYGLQDERVVRYVTDQGANIKAALADLVVVQRDLPQPEIREAVPQLHGLEEEADELFEDENPEDFFAAEEEMERVFPRRLSCYAHVMNCACRTVLDAEGSPVQQLKNLVLPLIVKFSASSVATQALKRLAGKKLLNTAKHRWNSFWYVCPLCAQSIQ